MSSYEELGGRRGRGISGTKRPSVSLWKRVAGYMGRLTHISTDAMGQKGQHSSFHTFPKEKKTPGSSLGPLSTGPFLSTGCNRTAEEELHASEERLRALIDGSIQGICIHCGFRLLFVNQTCADLLGYSSPDELLALGSVEKLVTPEDLPRLKSYSEARQRGETVPDQYELEAVRKDGSRIWLEQKVSFIDWEGEAATQSTIFDITERKQALEDLRAARDNLETLVEQRTRELADEISERKTIEIALRESEERFRAVIDNSPASISLKDAHGGYLLVNHGFERCHGLHREAVLGKTASDIFPENIANRIKISDDEVVESGDPVSFEVNIVEADGRPHTRIVNKFPIHDSSGAIVRIGTIGTDITGRKPAEEALRESEEQFRAVLDNASAVITLRDQDGHYLLVNREFERRFDIAASQVLGIKPESFLPPEISEQIATQERLVQDTARAQMFEVRIDHNDDGAPTTYHMTRFPVFDSQGEITRIGSFAIDISDRKKSEQALVAARDQLELRVQERTRALEQEIVEREFTQSELQKANEELERRVEERTQHLEDEIAERKRLEAQFVQAQKMEAVGQLAGGIAHDFNNLLTVVVANLGWLKEFAVSDDHALNVINLALEGARRAGDLTQRMLVFSRRQALCPEVIDFENTLTDFQPLIVRALRESTVLETAVDPGLWKLDVDRQQLENSILNVAINARDAMPDGGLFVLRAHNRVLKGKEAGRRSVSKGEYVELTMTDTGMGMSREIIERVFDPFFTTKEVGKGSGLGLSMVFGFAEQSGGSVDVESTVGKGTSVRLLLPRSESKPDKREKASKDAKSVSVGGLAVLVVEDDELVRNVVVEYLKMADIQVMQAENGESAIEVLERHGPMDVVISDVIMPGMNGIDLADVIRERWPDTRVILMTGYSYDEFARRGIDPESMIVLRKPFSKADLLAKIGDAMGED